MIEKPHVTNRIWLQRLRIVHRDWVVSWKSYIEESCEKSLQIECNCESKGLVYPEEFLVWKSVIEEVENPDVDSMTHLKRNKWDWCMNRVDLKLSNVCKNCIKFTINMERILVLLSASMLKDIKSFLVIMNTLDFTPNIFRLIQHNQMRSVAFNWCNETSHRFNVLRYNTINFKL